MLRKLEVVVMLASLMIGYGAAQARTIEVNSIRVEYDDFFKPQCAILYRHTIDGQKAGWSVYDLCGKYKTSTDDDVIHMTAGSPGQISIPVKKKDFISLDELSPWTGITPIRAYYDISRKRDDPDPDIAPSYLPYDNWNKVSNYMIVDPEGYEVGVVNNRRTGYRFYEFSGWCYLATETKPRMFKYFTRCTDPAYTGFPKSIDTVSRPWINIMERNTSDLGEQMPGGEIRSTTPNKPLIYSDFPIGDGGRVTKGRAMCMADCAPGMLMKLLRAGQSIWGSSGNPATVKQ